MEVRVWSVQLSHINLVGVTQLVKVNARPSLRRLGVTDQGAIQGALRRGNAFVKKATLGTGVC